MEIVLDSSVLVAAFRAAELQLPFITFDVELAHRASSYTTVVDIGTMIEMLS